MNPASPAMLNLYPLPNAAGQLQHRHLQFRRPAELRRRISAWRASITTSPTRIHSSPGIRPISEPGPRTAGLGLWPTYDLTHNQFLTVGEHHIFSPTLINEFDASFSRPITSEIQPAQHAALQIFTPAREDAYVAMPGGLSPLGASFINPFQYIENKFTERDDLKWIKGAHTISIGAIVPARAAQCIAYTYWNGFYAFTSIPNFYAGSPVEFTGAPNGGTNTYRGRARYPVHPLHSGRLEGQQPADTECRAALRLGIEPDRDSQQLLQRRGPALRNRTSRTCRNAFVQQSRRTRTSIPGSVWRGTCSEITRPPFAPASASSMTRSKPTRSLSAYLTNPPYLTENQFFTGGDPNLADAFRGRRNAAAEQYQRDVLRNQHDSVQPGIHA